MFICHWPKHVIRIEKCPPQVMSPHFGYWQLWCQHNIWLVGFVVWIGHWSSWKNKMAGKRLIGRTWAHTPWQSMSYPVVLDPIGKELNPPNYCSLTILSKPRPNSHKAGQTYPILFHHFRMTFVGQKPLFPFQI